MLLKVPQNVEFVVTTLLWILHTCVQTQDEKPGHGLVKEEFQAAMEWLFVPLIKKDVQERADANAETFSGKSMHEVIKEWRLKLSSCFELLKAGKWQSDVLNHTRKPAMKAEQEYDAAQALADEAKATCDALKSEAQSKYSQAHAADRQLKAHLQSGVGSELAYAAYQAAQASIHDARAAAKAASDAELQYNQAQHAAAAAEAKLEERLRAYEKALIAFEPSLIPFFLMMDNCPSYSPFADKKQKQVLPICPMLQVGATSQAHACFHGRCGYMWARN